MIVTGSCPFTPCGVEDLKDSHQQVLDTRLMFLDLSEDYSPVHLSHRDTKLTTDHLLIRPDVWRPLVGRYWNLNYLRYRTNN